MPVAVAGSQGCACVPWDVARVGYSMAQMNDVCHGLPNNDSNNDSHLILPATDVRCWDTVVGPNSAVAGDSFRDNDMSDFPTRLAASQLLKVVAQAANNDEDRAAVALLHSLLERDHKSEMSPPTNGPTNAAHGDAATAYAVMVIDTGTLRLLSVEVFSEPEPTLDGSKYSWVYERATAGSYGDAVTKLVNDIETSPCHVRRLEAMTLCRTGAIRWIPDANWRAPVHVFTFVSDELPDVNAVIPFGTRAEALAFVQGFEYWDDGESIALIWPFDALDLIAAIDAECDADAIMINVRARAAALGLAVTS